MGSNQYWLAEYKYIDLDACFCSLDYSEGQYELQAMRETQLPTGGIWLKGVMNDLSTCKKTLMEHFNILINNPNTERRKYVHQTWRCHKTRKNCKYWTDWIELKMSATNWEMKYDSKSVKFNKEKSTERF